jgi:enterochelin esterase-like enzyme
MMTEGVPQQPVVCEHLRAVLADLLARGARVTFAGQAWSRNCRMWVYLDRALDLKELRARHSLGPSVIDHEHRGTHDGRERGLVCTLCHDGIMGTLPDDPVSSGG